MLFSNCAYIITVFTSIHFYCEANGNKDTNTQVGSRWFAGGKRGQFPNSKAGKSKSDKKKYVNRDGSNNQYDCLDNEFLKSATERKKSRKVPCNRLRSYWFIKEQQKTPFVRMGIDEIPKQESGQELSPANSVLKETTQTDNESNVVKSQNRLRQYWFIKNNSDTIQTRFIHKSHKSKRTRLPMLNKSVKVHHQPRGRKKKKNTHRYRIDSRFKMPVKRFRSQWLLNENLNRYQAVTDTSLSKQKVFRRRRRLQYSLPKGILWPNEQNFRKKSTHLRKRTNYAGRLESLWFMNGRGKIFRSPTLRPQKSDVEQEQSLATLKLGRKIVNLLNKARNTHRSLHRNHKNSRKSKFKNRVQLIAEDQQCPNSAKRLGLLNPEFEYLINSKKYSNRERCVWFAKTKVTKKLPYLSRHVLPSLQKTNSTTEKFESSKNLTGERIRGVDKGEDIGHRLRRTWLSLDEQATTSVGSAAETERESENQTHIQNRPGYLTTNSETFESPQRRTKNSSNHNRIRIRRSVISGKQNSCRNTFWAAERKIKARKIPTNRMKKLWFVRDRGRTPISRFLRSERSKSRRVKLSAPNTKLSDKIKPAVKLKGVWLVQSFKKFKLPNRILKESTENDNLGIRRKTISHNRKEQRIRGTTHGINQMKPLQTNVYRRKNRPRIVGNAKISTASRIRHTWFINGKKDKRSEDLFKPPDSRLKQRRRMMGSTTGKYNNLTVPHRSHTKRTKGTWLIADFVRDKEHSGPLVVSRRYQKSNPHWIRSSRKIPLGVSAEKPKSNKKTVDKTDGTWFFRRDHLALKRRKHNSLRRFVRKFLRSHGRGKWAEEHCRKNYCWINGKKKPNRFSDDIKKTHRGLDTDAVDGDGKVRKSKKHVWTCKLVESITDNLADTTDNKYSTGKERLKPLKTTWFSKEEKETFRRDSSNKKHINSRKQPYLVCKPGNHLHFGVSEKNKNSIEHRAIKTLKSTWLFINDDDVLSRRLLPSEKPFGASYLIKPSPRKVRITRNFNSIPRKKRKAFRTSSDIKTKFNPKNNASRWLRNNKDQIAAVNLPESGRRLLNLENNEEDPAIRIVVNSKEVDSKMNAAVENSTTPEKWFGTSDCLQYFPNKNGKCKIYLTQHGTKKTFITRVSS